MKKILSYALLIAAAVSVSFSSVAGSGHSTSLLDSGLLTNTPDSPLQVSTPSAAECQPGVADIVVHDDGEAENGYGWNLPAVYGKFADPFEPASYPATITSVCLALVTSKASDQPLDFTLAVYEEDSGGGPGALLGAKDFTGNAVSIPGVPFQPAFEAFDISSLGIEITSGRVFISVEWEATAEHQDIYLAADQSSSTPLAGGYMESENEPWAPIEQSHTEYRALFIRAVMPESQPAATPPAVPVPMLGLWSVLLMIVLLGGVAVRRLM